MDLHYYAPPAFLIASFFFSLCDFSFVWVCLSVYCLFAFH